ncbi:Phenazine biosynthesis protein PhzF family [Parafrankia sp. Ea1.12]|uniref:PhzF family phenazine biosynthesis protein n=1 Tax=Parafrankia sp. Ea1.12 TaxID=573499 RepID=UPI000DA451F7|nr:PhzF family phenazine biosynthesis protein [Parafrankia sp. Ea1.12]SQD97619.1 Phenazine biosynthesis protein PhzF family [Parafrankia sp. Ea1.12]
MTGRMLRYVCVDVFSDSAYRGNPLAVVLDCDDLDAGQMKSVAREFNYSETVFLGQPTSVGATVGARIFSPAAELPFAGHPSIGTAMVAAHLGDVLDRQTGEIILDLPVGPVRVTVEKRTEPYSGSAELTFPGRTEKGPQPPDEKVMADVLGIPVGEIDTTVGLAAVGAGVRFLIVPLRTLSAMEGIRFDLAAWRAEIGDFWAPQIYAFTAASVDSGADFRVRMFSPALGVLEDTGTGAGAVALASYLHGRRRESELPNFGFVLEQGVELGRASRLECRVAAGDDGTPVIRVKGEVVFVGAGTRVLPLSGDRPR